jgi:hypothetical protein
MNNSSKVGLSFIVINIFKHGEHYETPCIIQGAEGGKEKDMRII